MRNRRNFRGNGPNRRPGRQGHRPAPSIQRMAELLQRAGISLKPNQLDQLWRYHNLLRARNDDRELTRIIEFEAMVVKHYIDSMIVGQFVQIPSPVVDIGTGAGFPGIPLKIRYPNLEMILAEPRPKRITFLKEASQALGFQKVSVFEHKVTSRSFHQPVAAVVTRAVETIDKTCLRTSACLAKGGLIILLKGPGVDPELHEVARRFKNQFRLKLDQHYVLPHTSHDRRLVVLEKLVPAQAPKDAIIEAEVNDGDTPDSDL